MFERKHGVSLPDDYRAFLLEHNGGEPVPNIYRISDEQGESDVSHFHGLHNGPDWARLDSALEVYHGRIPAALIPIGGDSGGNAICLGAVGDRRGRVYFWDHECESEGEPGLDNCHPVAESFTAFLDGLYESEPLPRAAWEIAIENDDREHVRRLIASGMHREVVNDVLQTPVEVAGLYGRLEILKMLLAADAEPGRALVYACSRGHKDIIRLLLPADGPVDDELLFRAATSRQYETVKYLLTLGANPNAANRAGTPLMWFARRSNDEELIAILKAAGARHA